MRRNESFLKILFKRSSSCSLVKHLSAILSTSLVGESFSSETLISSPLPQVFLLTKLFMERTYGLLKFFISFRSRRALWSTITYISSIIERPWLLMGEFNFFLFSNKKCGGNPTRFLKMSYFKECVLQSKHMDLSNYGLFFT